MRTLEQGARILRVDLGSRTAKKETVDPTVERDFIGGFGVGIKLTYDLVEPKMDPFDPRNPIILSAGALGGTRAPGSSRFCAITKYPLTGAVAMGNGGMRFSSKLRASGYEHVIVNGKAPTPTIIKISNDRVDFLDAHHLWGKDLYETTDILWERFGEKWSVMAIGQAGENQVKISLALVDKFAHIGKGGLSAVMGSKNLKAIMVNGSQTVPVSDPIRFEGAVKRILKRVKALPNRDEIINLGVYAKWDNWCKEGFPMKGGTEIFPKKKATELYGPQVYLEKVKKGRAGCPSCPLPDKEIMGVNEGEFTGLRTFGSGFAGRASNYGILCGVGGYDRVLKIHDLANRLGICSHAFSSLYDFAVELFEKGRITPKDTGGIELKRDFETTRKVMEMTALHKESFGDIMAEGYNGFFKRFGEDLKAEALQAKGMDMLYDPRLIGLNTRAFIMVVNPRGGHHQPGAIPGDSPGKRIEDIQKWCENMGVPTDARERIFGGPLKVNMARLAKHNQEFYSVLCCLGICSKAPIRPLYTMEDCADLYSSLKGIEVGPAELKKAAERVWNLYKMINVREGFDRKDDLFPPKWFTPMKGEEGQKVIMDYFGTRQLTVQDLQSLLDDYYDECGWDRRRGIPEEQKLKELGLIHALEDIRESK